MLNHTIIKNPNDSRLWSLHGGIKWIGDIQELYNRPCYDEITKNLSSLTHALVIGTPGIGKTLYLQVLLVYLVTRAKEEGRATPTIHFVYEAKKKVVTLSFLSDGSVIDVSDVGPVLAPEYLLSDSADLAVAYGTILNLEVASEKESNYNIFQKHIEQASKGNLLVMPVFSLRELQSIQPADMDGWCAEFRHDVFGGSARNFKCLQLRNFDVLPVVDETLTLMFPDVKQKHYDAWDCVACQVSAKLTGKAADEKRTIVNSMMRHMQSRGTKTWASKFMELLAAAIVDDRTAEVVDELERLIGTAGIGNLFEAIGHRKLLRSTVPFLLKPLLASSLSPTKPAFERTHFNLSVVRLKTVDDIANLPNGTYGIPLTNTFPVADAIIQPDTIVQFTISPEKHKGSLEQLAEIRKRLWASPNDHRIIFVIPSENVNTFRYHPKLAGIRQLVCAVDPSVMGERSLMSEEEKKAGNVTGKGARSKKRI